MDGLIFVILRYVKVFLSSKGGIIRSTSPLHVLYINSPKVRNAQRFISPFYFQAPPLFVLLPFCFFLQYLHVSVKYLLGSRMPHKCVKLFHCGTHAPGWLSGAHPLITEGAVMRQVCFHWNGDCCYFKQQILVRNCEDFYVYELPGTEKSFLRYCGNSKKHHHLELQ